MKMDLHTHTNNSDGDLDILGNVLEAKKNNLDGIAITDHDNIDSWKEIDSHDYPIKVIKGVEVSTYYKGESVHVLGYYLNDGGDYTELEEFLKNSRNDRIKRLDKMIKLLADLGINIDKEDVIKEAHGSVGRPHVASVIMKKYPEYGFTKDKIFDKFIGNDAPAYVPVNHFETDKAVKLLHRNHCLVIIAHPLLLKQFDYRELADLGIDGYEGYYRYSKETYDDVLEFVKEKNLMVTGGSDYHGPITTRDRIIGEAYLEGEDLKKFLKKINYK